MCFMALKLESAPFRLSRRSVFGVLRRQKFQPIFTFQLVAQPKSYISTCTTHKLEQNFSIEQFFRPNKCHTHNGQPVQKYYSKPTPSQRTYEAKFSHFFPLGESNNPFAFLPLNFTNRFFVKCTLLWHEWIETAHWNATLIWKYFLECYKSFLCVALRYIRSD